MPRRRLCEAAKPRRRLRKCTSVRRLLERWANLDSPLLSRLLGHTEKTMAGNRTHDSAAIGTTLAIRTLFPRGCKNLRGYQDGHEKSYTWPELKSSLILL